MRKRGWCVWQENDLAIVENIRLQLKDINQLAQKVDLVGGRGLLVIRELFLGRRLLSMRLRKQLTLGGIYCGCCLSG